MLDKIHQALGMEKLRINRLIAATVKGDTGKMATLLDAGVNIDAVGLGPYPEAPESTGPIFSMTPLMAACKWSQPESVELLLTLGAAMDPQAMDESIIGLIDSKPRTKKADQARAVVAVFIKAGCRFEGNVGEEYSFAQSSPSRHNRIDGELRRLYPGESLDMAVLIAKHSPALQGRKPGL